MNIPVTAEPSHSVKLEFNRCTICNKLNSYWWLYCSEHQDQVDADMEPKNEYVEPEEIRYE